MAKKAVKATEPKEERIQIPQLELKEFDLSLIGDSPLVCHKWSEKAKAEIRDKQAKKAKQGRAKRDPKAEYRASLYEHPDGGYGFPTIAFKAAAVRAAKQAGMTMTDARCCFHVAGELVKIKGKPAMREDMVRVSNGAADIRYRSEFTKWSAVIRVRYNAAVISAEQLINLFNIAGFGVGVGEHRTEKDGAWGMWHVEAQAA
jgi:hypothetical protein